jgi:hypothetical protein
MQSFVYNALSAHPWGFPQYMQSFVYNALSAHPWGFPQVDAQETKHPQFMFQPRIVQWNTHVHTCKRRADVYIFSYVVMANASANSYYVCPS